MVGQVYIGAHTSFWRLDTGGLDTALCDVRDCDVSDPFAAMQPSVINTSPLLLNLQLSLPNKPATLPSPRVLFPEFSPDFKTNLSLNSSPRAPGPLTPIHSFDPRVLRATNESTAMPFTTEPGHYRIAGTPKKTGTNTIISMLNRTLLPPIKFEKDQEVLTVSSALLSLRSSSYMMSDSPVKSSPSKSPSVSCPPLEGPNIDSSPARAIKRNLQPLSTKEVGQRRKRIKTLGDISNKRFVKSQNITSNVRTPTPKKKARSSDGCWTCRIRKKLCSKNNPVCLNCDRLGLTCDFSTERPDYMKYKSLAEKKLQEIKEVTNRFRKAKGI